MQTHSGIASLETGRTQYWPAYLALLTMEPITDMHE